MNRSNTFRNTSLKHNRIEITIPNASITNQHTRLFTLLNPDNLCYSIVLLFKEVFTALTGCAVVKFLKACYILQQKLVDIGVVYHSWVELRLCALWRWTRLVRADAGGWSCNSELKFLSACINGKMGIKLRWILLFLCGGNKLHPDVNTLVLI